MSRMRFAKVDPRYLLFAELYTDLDQPKSKRKAFLILEAAITCYARKGLSTATMDMIAREAGVSRTVVLHYFTDTKALRELSVKYIRLLFQKLAVEAIGEKTAIDDQLRAYVASCFYWTRNFKTHAVVWLDFLLQCAKDAKLRELNTLASDTGADRIAALLEAGCGAGVFKITDVHATAQAVQALIAGALVASRCQNLEDVDKYAGTLSEHCLRLAGV